MTQVAVVSDTALLGGCDRLVVSPAHGRITLEMSVSYTTEGEVVRNGDVLASIDSDGTVIEVCAPCDAWLMDHLARDGQRVEPGSPIAHLRKL